MKMIILSLLLCCTLAGCASKSDMEEACLVGALAAVRALKDENPVFPPDANHDRIFHKIEKACEY